MTTTILSLETKKINQAIQKLIDLVIDNHDQAKIALKTNDKALALKVIDDDQVVDALYSEIESDLEFLISKAPVNKNLRRTLTGIHIAREIARIGDYAKNIAKFIIKNQELSKSSINRIYKVHHLFRAMLANVHQVIESENLLKAKEIASLEEELIKATNKIRRAIITSVSAKKDEKKVSERIFVFSIISALERGADRIVGILEFVSYINSGHYQSFK